MGFWITIILWAATFAVSQLLTPEPELENARAAGLDEFDFPTATEGRVIPLGWGTDRISGPNILWYGNLRSYAITERVETSLFNTKRVTVGHWYSVGFQLGICVGPAALRKIWIGDELVWQGNKTTDGDIVLDHELARGTFSFYTGSKTQAIDPYLATHQTIATAYRGLAYGVFKDGYVGESKQIKPWAFEMTRIPTGLGTTHPTVNGWDCNPMEMMYEMLTNSEVGYAYPDADIDLDEFRTVGETLYDEGNGISLMLMTQKKLTQIIKLIERQCDCRFRIDPSTGKWRVVLARSGYSIPSLRKADDTNIMEIVDFSKATWDQTINSVRIAYKRRSNDYTNSYAPAQDDANMRMQNQIVPATWTFEGVRDDTLANRIAWHELRSNSFPLSKGRFKMNRDFWDAYEGEVFALSHVIEGIEITDLPMRITRIEVGSKEDPHILVDAVQDIFSWYEASFNDPDPTAWVPPPTGLVPFPTGEQIAFESPYAMSRREPEYFEGLIYCSGQAQGRGETGFRIRQRNAAGTPAGYFADAGDSPSFMTVGTLDGAIDNDAATMDVYLGTTELARLIRLFNWGLPAGPTMYVNSTSASSIGNNLTNLIVIGNEFIAYTGVAIITSGSGFTGGIRLSGCYRGMLDSAQAVHADDVPVYLINAGGTLSDTQFPLTNNVHLRLLPFKEWGNIIDEGDAGLVQIDLTMDTRVRRPYPPTLIEWNSSQYPATVNITGDVVVDYNRRDYRIYNEVSQMAADASTINADFPANNDTRYRLKLYDGVSLVYTTPWNASGAATYTMEFEKILRYLDGLPTTLTMSVDTRHTFSAVDYEALQEVLHEATVTASSYDDDFWLGVLSPSTASNIWTAPQTGTYAFTLGSTIAGDVEARINGGSWVQVIASGNPTGNLAGVTASDTIEVQHLDAASSDEVLLTIAAPSGTEDGFGILIFA